MASAREVHALDPAARLAVRADERLGDLRRHVVVHLGVGEPHRRQRARLAPGHDASDAGLRHRRLVGEVPVVRRDQPVRIEGRPRLRRLLRPPDHVAVAGQGIGDGILSEHEDDRVIARTRVQRAVGRDDRDTGVRRDAGTDADQQREVAAARLAGETDARRAHAETASVSSHPAHARGHVGARRRMLVLRALTKIEGRDDDSGGGEAAPEVDADGPIAPAPRAAVSIDDSDQRRGRLAPGTIHAREQLAAVGPGVDDVGFLDFVRRARIEANVRGHGASLLFTGCARPRARRRCAPRSNGRTRGGTVSGRGSTPGSAPSPRTR